MRKDVRFAIMSLGCLALSHSYFLAISIFLTAELNSSACTYCIFMILSPIDGHLGWFCCLVSMTTGRQEPPC